MSAERFSLSEFSEFLDDSDGHRLAQFLQKKSGAERPGCRRIFNHESERFSLNVRFKRVSSPTQPPPPPKEGIEQPKNADKFQNSNAESDNNPHVEIKEEQVDLLESKPKGQCVTGLETGHAEGVTAPHETFNNTRQTASESSSVCVVIPSLNCNAQLLDEALQTQVSTTMCQQKVQLSKPQPSCLSQRTLACEKKQLSEIPEDVQHNAISDKTQHPEPTSAPIPRTESASVQTEPTVHPLRSTVETQIQCNSPLSNSVSQPATPRSVSPQLARSPQIFGSGGVGSRDRLRKQVLKRLSTFGNNGRRTLLKEFESTLSSADFVPQIYSTPMHHTPPENLQRTPIRKSNNPTAGHFIQNVADNPVADISQLSLSKPQNQRDQPFIRNMVEALEETIKKLKGFESSQVQSRSAPGPSKNATFIPKTQELLQQAQTTASQNLNTNHAPATQELLQEVQKALNDLMSQVQTPKIVIPVNQTFNNAPAPTRKEPSNNDGISVNDSPQHAREKEPERTQAPMLCHATFTHSHSSGNPVEIAPNIDSPHTIKHHAPFKTISREQEHQNLTGYQSRSRISHRQTFTKQNKTQTEEGTDSLKVHIRQECRSPMRPINQETNTNRTIIQTKAPIVRIKRLNENRKSISSSVVEYFQNNVSHKSPPPPTSRLTFTKQNEANELLAHQVCVDRRSAAHTSTRSTLTNINVPIENVASIPARLTTAEPASAELITEDEDEEEIYYIQNKMRSLRKSGPLNLAAERHPPTMRSRRTIKRPSTNRRKISTVNTSPLITSDTETDSGPPPAHPLNLHHVKRDLYKSGNQLKRPLNKPPNTPKNGEKFADELKAHLARLTNHEILDLRKRNSMGQVLMAPTRLRKSITGKDQVLPEQIKFEEQLQIEEQIQLEILRRDLLGTAKGLHVDEEGQNQEQGNKTVEEVEGDELIFNELPSVPALFKDNVTPMQQTILHLSQRPCYNSSLVDDNINERVSFRSPNKVNNCTSQGRPSRSRKKKSENLPETTKRYMELQKKVRKRMQQNTSKRSLYTKGDSASESEMPAANVSSEKENCPHTPPIVEPIPPPPSISPIYDLYIPSPPPPLALSSTSSRDHSPPPSPALLSMDDEYLSPPAPFLDNRPGKSPAKNVNASVETLVSAATATEEAACPTANDDDLFKKPTMLPPRASHKGKKATGAKKARTDATTGSEAMTTDTTRSSDEIAGLRRSKRGQVPRKLSYLCGTPNGRPLLQSLLEEVERRSYKAKMQRLSRSRAASNNNDMSMPDASSTVNKATAKAQGRRSRHPKANTQARTFSFLGDTNTTSGTVTSACSITGNSNVNRLRAIAEAPTESDCEVRLPENAGIGAPTTSHNDIPATTAQNKAPRQKKSGRPRKDPGKTNKNQQQINVISENVLQARENAANEPIEIPPHNQPASETGTVNRTGVLECSRVYLPPPPPLYKLNEMFDQLKSEANSSSDETSSSASHTENALSSAATIRGHTRKVRVRLRRLCMPNTTTTTATSNPSSSMSSTRASTATQSAESSGGNELLTWLKNVTHLQSATNRGEVYMDMRPSTAGRLFFTDLEGIDYAFYDTVDKSSLGYLRFKPLQSKPLKRTKKYILHFVVLAGSFQIGTEREHGTFNVGDMVAINIGCRYQIKNLDNDIGILMVIKK